MTNVEMPKANENLTEATLDRWLVKEGQSVTKDQSLCDIITDKAKFEMPSPAAGTVLKLLAPERALLPVGYVMCVLGTPSESVPSEVAAANEKLLAAHRASATALASSATSTGSAQTAGTAVGGAGVRATPAARRIAKEKGVDLAEVVKTLSLTGPVNEKDIARFLEQR